MVFNVCTPRPEALAEAVLCLDEISKNASGELRLIDAEVRKCEKLGCQTLTAEHVLRLRLESHDCDSQLGKGLDGTLISKDLTSAFVDGSGERRGMHTATFSWRTRIGILRGQMSGMTNEGTHREPVFEGCQKCDERGVMEGMLCGQVVRAEDKNMVGAQVTAAYRLSFDPSELGGEGAIRGTLEGLVVREGSTDKC